MAISIEQTRIKREKCLEPLLKDFCEWTDLVNAASQSKSDKAITYLCNQWKYLSNMLKDDRLSLFNDLVERSIRPVVLGRKNDLFSTRAQGSTFQHSLLHDCRNHKSKWIECAELFELPIDMPPQIDLLTEEALLEFLP